MCSTNFKNMGAFSGVVILVKIEGGGGGVSLLGEDPLLATVHLS